MNSNFYNEEKPNERASKMENITREIMSDEYRQIVEYFMPIAKELAEIKKIVEVIGKNRFLKTMENWINGEEVIQVLKISKRTLQSYRDKGLLGYTQIGNKIYYKVEEIQQLMEKNYKK
jgi:hypothetical protein